MGKGNVKKPAGGKKGNDLIFSILLVVAVFVLAIVAIVYTKKQQEKKNKGNDSNPFVYERDYTEESAKYSAGLTDDGKIKSVSNIGDYVKLGKTDGLTLYLADHPIDSGLDIYNAGDYLIGKICEDSEIKKNEDYYKVLCELYEYIIHSWYNSYEESHAKIDESQKYNSFEEYMLYAQGMDQERYESFVVESAEKEMKKYLVVQALAEKIGVTVDEQEITNFALAVDSHARDESDTETTRKRYGMPYMYQRTAEYKVAKYLVEHADKKEGSIKDNWTDNSSVYSAGLYDNGKISGIGNINNYVKISDELLDYPSVEQVIDFYMDNAEFTDYADYLEKVEAVCELKYGKGEYDPAYEMHYRMLIQALYDRYELDISHYKTDFNKDKTMDEIEEEKYCYGEPYVNQLIMEYAVKQKLKEIYSPKAD